MHRVRRNMPEVRLEMTPLIDVVFLLLTFFVFSIVLMVRAERLEIVVPELVQGEPIEAGSGITVGVSRDGEYFVNQDPVGIDDLAGAVRTRLGEQPGSVLSIAADEGAPWGAVMAVVERLKAEGLTTFNLIGSPR
jgi:biopolymer transport protein ExbD